MLVIFAAGLLISACADPKKQQKELLDDIIKAHDKVMADDEKAELNKMRLDTLLKQKPALKPQIAPLTAEVTLADSNMETWMQQFKPDYTGKSTDEVVKYLSGQKKELTRVDSQLQAVIIKSGQFIIKNK